jgi:hypothetical protein
VVNNGEKRNFNMPNELKSSTGQSSWPVKYPEYPNDWLHSDFRSSVTRAEKVLAEKMKTDKKLKRRWKKLNMHQISS